MKYGTLQSKADVPLELPFDQTKLQENSGAVCRGGAGVPPVNHAQDARATFKMHHYLEEQYLGLNAGLWDWFRWAAAFKMSAASLDTVFLSLERFKFLSRPAFIVTAIAALLGVGGALFYGYRLLVVRGEMKEKFGNAKVQQPINIRCVYGGVLYFNASDSALFAGKYVFNFGNKWAWVLIGCIIAYPLLVFLPR